MQAAAAPLIEGRRASFPDWCWPECNGVAEMTAATSLCTMPETGRDWRSRRVLHAQVPTDRPMPAAAAPFIEGKRASFPDWCWPECNGGSVMIAATSPCTMPETGCDRRPRRGLHAQVPTDRPMPAAAAPFIEGRRRLSGADAGRNAVEWLEWEWPQ
jgi:hypothetical protein